MGSCPSHLPMPVLELVLELALEPLLCSRLLFQSC